MTTEVLGQADGTPARAAAPGPRRTLVGGVGYTNLRDLSVGPLLADRLGSGAWPAGVDVEDLSAGAIHVLHALQARPAYDAAVLVAAVRREDPPGTVRQIRWRHPRRPDAEVQDRVSEALMGVIGLDILLTVLDRFGVLPDDTMVIEVEPRDEGWGGDLSPDVEAAADRVEGLVRAAVGVAG